MRKTLSIALAAILMLAAGWPAAYGQEPATFAEAKALAEKLDQPLLIDLYAVW
jgi:hypothetical protein